FMNDLIDSNIATLSNTNVNNVIGLPAGSLTQLSTKIWVFILGLNSGGFEPASSVPIHGKKISMAYLNQVNVYEI
ncbi:hypothetical protein L9F63_004938, partial [Diploptera punctata]